MDDTYVVYVNNETGVANVRHHDGDTGVSKSLFKGMGLTPSSAVVICVALQEAHDRGCEKTLTTIKTMIEQREQSYVRAKRSRP